MGDDETEKAVPLVPNEITKSPSVAPIPSAAAALSPAPDAITVLPIRAPASPGATTLGRNTSVFPATHSIISEL